MFGATKIVKNSDKSKYVYSGYEIALDGKGEWNFGNDSAGDAIIFGVDNRSSSHTDNHKNNFLVLGQGDTFGMNGSFCAPEKKSSISPINLFEKIDPSFQGSINRNFQSTDRVSIHNNVQTVTFENNT